MVNESADTEQCGASDSCAPHSRPGLSARIVLSALDFYQKGISPLSPPSCRFEPTCSNYAIEAIRTRGVLIGLMLAAWRLVRCAPWSAGGWDPVPQPRGHVSRGGAHLRGTPVPDPP